MVEPQPWRVARPCSPSVRGVSSCSGIWRLSLWPEFGPAAYGAYGVIMLVLVWLEESGRFAIPSATTKLLAESTTLGAALERTALALNLTLYALLFVLLWTAAPWLESWFGIENGAVYFRIAAIDLPFFGAYTVYRAIHQGYERFFQLGCAQVIYAATKLVGVLQIISFGLSVENALMVNVAATIVGLACLFPGAALEWQGRWLEKWVRWFRRRHPWGSIISFYSCAAGSFSGRFRSCHRPQQGS